MAFSISASGSQLSFPFLSLLLTLNSVYISSTIESFLVSVSIWMEAFPQSVHVQMFCVQSSDTRDIRECAECKEIKSRLTLTHFSSKEMEMEVEAERGLWQVQMSVIALETMSTNCSYNIKVDITPNALTRLCRLK